MAVHRLATNENPLPPLPSVLAAAAAALGTAHHYPDPAVPELTAALAAAHDVPVPDVTLGAGSVNLIQQVVLGLAGPGDEVVHAWPSFEAYPEMVRIARARPVPVPLGPGAVHDLDAMAAAVTGATRLVFVCSPNNPTGPAIHRADLERFLDAVPERVPVLLDEAYLEFVRDDRVPDGIDVYRERANVGVLRTFSKAHGLAGLRVGYLVARQDVTAAARATTPPYRVTDVAQAAALASLRARDEVARRVDTIVAERERVLAVLRGHGVWVPDSQANFFWLGLGDGASSFARECQLAGIAVKAFPGEGVRVGIGDPAANDAFLGLARGLVPDTPPVIR